MAAPSSNDARKPNASATDLELHLLQSFGAFASDKVLASYVYVKQSSRILDFLASTTEHVVTKSGLATLVGFLFRQYQRLGHPWVQYVDDAMGRRIIDAFVNVLWLAKQQQDAATQAEEPSALESGDALQQAIKLSYQERVQALLQGQVPRLQELLAPSPAPVMVMDLQDFVPKDEMERLKEESQEQMGEMQREMTQLREQLKLIEREKQQVEQQLTDVHNYQESERGRRFQEMEEELARTKLEASQKAQDHRKLELVIEAMRKKRKGGRSSRSVAASSDGPPSPSRTTTGA
ncbi:hypothetical protein Poli38472_011803 [Pythium oligandrum]|uniref:Uncharacterized protein n=1 Tax=Pythium oligandrum TaxID=41045 RepID=A0A8K1FCD9_PYTOL|nr:hypothetical protein Poli38472_011803 [Pythium oligandrum]|eukprot:TMW58215.1 hypothetical protein Poli38472_011803 [Pythium oligandrum]